MHGWVGRRPLNGFEPWRRRRQIAWSLEEMHVGIHRLPWTACRHRGHHAYRASQNLPRRAADICTVTAPRLVPLRPWCSLARSAHFIAPLRQLQFIVPRPRPFFLIWRNAAAAFTGLILAQRWEKMLLLTDRGFMENFSHRAQRPVGTDFRPVTPLSTCRSSFHR